MKEDKNSSYSKCVLLGIIGGFTVLVVGIILTLSILVFNNNGGRGQDVVDEIREYYELFPSVPTLGFVSQAAQFIDVACSEDWSFDIFGYERTYIYGLSETMVDDAIDEYEAALLERGFIRQYVFDEEEIMWVYFYHEEQHISVTLLYLRDAEEMMVSLGPGNIHEQVYGVYIPSNATLDEALLGSWVWDENRAFTYVFYDDGTGRLGTFLGRQDFNWTTYDGDLFLIFDLGYDQSWSYVINEGVLTLDSNQLPGVTYSYTR